MEEHDDISSEYDVIVIGTGLVESIFAAAAARIGKAVLHLDSNNYYGSNWAVFGWCELQQWIDIHLGSSAARATLSAAYTIDDPSNPTCASSGSRLLTICQDSLIANVKQYISIPDKSDVAHCAGSADCRSGGYGKSRNTAVSGSGDNATIDDSHAVSADISSPDGVDRACTSLPRGSDHSSRVASEEPLPDSERPHPVDSGDVNNPDQSVDIDVCLSSCTLSNVFPSPDSSPGKPDAAVSCGESPVKPVLDCWTVDRFRLLNRRFNLELSPKVLFSRGSLVELLLSSNSARYVQFRCVEQIATPLHGRLAGVPCSRADVFNSTAVSVVEKRVLMKLLTACTDTSQLENICRGFEQKPFVEFLRSQRLTDDLVHYVVNAIAMVTPDTPTSSALIEMQRFLGSMGRYGNTPFLWPMYGSGELPQCFCRMCAVFGGVYHLDRGVEALLLEGDGAACCGVVSEGRELRCSCLVLSSCYRAAGRPGGPSSEGVSRAILLLDAPLYLPGEGGGDLLTLLRLPPGTSHLPVPATVLQLCPSSAAVPQGLFLVHVTCERQGGAEGDLRPVVDLLLEMVQAGDARRPRLLAEVYFDIVGSAGFGADLPSNVSVASGPDSSLCFESAVKQAGAMFSRHFPDEEFLPRMPDPDEIIFFEEEGSTE